MAYVPMPFQRSASVTLTNETDRPLNHLFYDVNVTVGEPLDDALYFHAYWHRARPNALGHDLEVLPRITGAGRFLGMNFGIRTDPRYQGAWWGEGEVKVWLDGDGEWPTLVGTGAEDYLGSAWGLGTFVGPYPAVFWRRERCEYAGYRYHIPDPIGSSATVGDDADIGAGAGSCPGDRRRRAPLGWSASAPRQFRARSIASTLDDPATIGRWCNFYRCDDWSSTRTSLDRRSRTCRPGAGAERVAGGATGDHGAGSAAVAHPALVARGDQRRRSSSQVADAAS